MKNVTMLLAILVACFAATATAQDAVPVDGTSLGVEADGMLPMGDFSDVSEFGVGGTVYLAHGIAPGLSITGRSGFLYFGGKEYAFAVGTTTGTAKVNITMIPILAGLKYFFTQGDSRVYGAAEAGLYMMSGSGDFTPTGGGAGASFDVDSESKFGVSPSLGVQFKAGEKMVVDAHANFSNVFTENSSTNWITFAIGFEFLMN